MAPYKALLWDNDGVLVDTESLFYEANRSTYARYGVTLSEENFIDYFLKDNCGAWHLLTAKGLGSGDLARIRQERESVYQNLISTSSQLAMPGVERILAVMSLRCRMGVVTSSSRSTFDVIHARTGFLPYFEFAVCSEDTPHTKPSPEPYLLALQRLGLQPADCLAIEDSPRGLEAAMGAGLACIAVRSRFTEFEAFAGAMTVVASAKELMAALTQALT